MSENSEKRRQHRVEIVIEHADYDVAYAIALECVRVARRMAKKQGGTSATASHTGDAEEDRTTADLLRRALDTSPDL